MYIQSYVRSQSCRMLCLFVPDTSGRLCLTFLTFHIYIFSNVKHSDQSLVTYTVHILSGTLWKHWVATDFRAWPAPSALKLLVVLVSFFRYRWASFRRFHLLSLGTQPRAPQGEKGESSRWKIHGTVSFPLQNVASLCYMYSMCGISMHTYICGFISFLLVEVIVLSDFHSNLKSTQKQWAEYTAGLHVTAWITCKHAHYKFPLTFQGNHVFLIISIT